MTDWRSAMRKAVEEGEQDCLSAAELQAMRRIVVASVTHDARDRAASMWTRRPVLVAATIVAIVSVAVGAALRLDPATTSPQTSASEPSTPPPAVDTPDTASPSAPKRQLQFMTAGGTRIIWIFNSDLDLRVTVQ